MPTCPFHHPPCPLQNPGFLLSWPRVLRKDDLARTAAPSPGPRLTPAGGGPHRSGLGITACGGVFRVSCPSGGGGVGHGDWSPAAKPETPPGPSRRPCPGSRAVAHLVLSESMVRKRPSSSFSLRTPSAKKSWNSSRDNLPSSARKEGGAAGVSEIRRPRIPMAPVSAKPSRSLPGRPGSAHSNLHAPGHGTSQRLLRLTPEPAQRHPFTANPRTHERYKQ